MFYKVENEVLIPAPEKGIKVFIANPTAEQYKQLGNSVCVPMIAAVAEQIKEQFFGE